MAPLFTGLPSSGAVLGVDIGYSPVRASGAACCLFWQEGRVGWAFKRFRFSAHERQAALSAAVQGRRLISASFDGPFRAQLDVIGHYRLAELMLTRKLGSVIGKPGSSGAPVGKNLNDATNQAVRDVLDHQNVAAATQPTAMFKVAIAEAFPNAFLGCLLAEPSEVVRGSRGDKSDRYYVALAQDGTFQRLLGAMLPDRDMPDFAAVTNHDDRAALVCALTSLTFANHDYVAVGDNDGWIILPPFGFIEAKQRELLVANGHEHTGALVIVSAAGAQIASTKSAGT